ncbi:MAG: adenylate/guanylate cyclase domain-containing protein [Deltaproteobacteria bacterium]|nr:adenylate/guanylate cyclase domain-containing protein [Deltaproteobacteria bacterium]
MPASDDQARVQHLEGQLELLEACQRLNDEADEALEQATQDRAPLDAAVQRLLPMLCRHTGAAAAELRTYDEELAMRDWRWPAEGARSPTASLSQPLDVAGEDFGSATIHFDTPKSEPALARGRRMLHAWCEQLDNYLAAIAQARHKHRITSQLSDALKHPVLEHGLVAAVERLRRTVAIDDLILAYHHEEDRGGETLSYKVIRAGAWCADSSGSHPNEHDEFMTEHALRFIAGDERAVLDRFGVDNPQEQVLINGIKDQRVIGRLVVSSSRSELNTFDRDLLERFADYLRQRIVDFNREYKHLALCFPPDMVARLLSQEDYEQRYLMPEVRDAAILYADITGFTRLSEQVLKEPELIGKLIDRWSEGVVDILWASGGVFDKMVGDCVIGLWGPPFFDLSGKEACQRALQAARKIRDFTSELGRSGVLPELEQAGSELGVAVGLNYCPLLVGLFGPNRNYTGFSAGMNMCARLQGVAARDEILCMDSFVRTLDESSQFGEQRSAAVKNVAEPLRFHPARQGA